MATTISAMKCAFIRYTMIYTIIFKVSLSYTIVKISCISVRRNVLIWSRIQLQNGLLLKQLSLSKQQLGVPAPVSYLQPGQSVVQLFPRARP